MLLESGWEIITAVRLVKCVCQRASSASLAGDQQHFSYSLLFKKCVSETTAAARSHLPPVSGVIKTPAIQL